MIIETGLLAVALLKLGCDMNEVDTNKKEAKRMSVRAAEIYYKSLAEEKKSNEKMQNTIARLANRKRAIISVSLPKFVEVYSKIARIEINKDSEGIKELSSPMLLEDFSKDIDAFLSVDISKLSDQELVSTYIFRGVTGIMVKESELEVHSARAQLKQARFVETMVDSKMDAVDMLCTHLNNITDVISKLNVLFLKSMKTANAIIDKNGYDGNNYSDKELVCIGTCKELAAALKGFLDTKILDYQSGLTDAAMNIISTGNIYLEAFQNAMEG